MSDFNPVIQDNPNYDKDFPATILPVKFFSSGKKLIGTFFQTAGKDIHPTIILLHGFPGNENNFDLAHALCRSGKNVMVFHYRGSWGSEGNFSWQSCIDDTHTAVEFLRDKKTSEYLRVNTNSIHFIGHSMGGFVAFMTAMDYPGIRNVASLAGFNFGLFAELIKNNNDLRKISIEEMVEAVDLLNGSNPEDLLQEMIINKDNWNLLNFVDKLSNKNYIIPNCDKNSFNSITKNWFLLLLN